MKKLDAHTSGDVGRKIDPKTLHILKRLSARLARSENTLRRVASRHGEDVYVASETPTGLSGPGFTLPSHHMNGKQSPAPHKPRRASIRVEA